MATGGTSETPAPGNRQIQDVVHSTAQLTSIFNKSMKRRKRERNTERERKREIGDYYFGS